ncbi:MAG: SpoIIE family protein phosphatase [Treponema sp.]|nr:SpoIIE family protein phosphatase [Treponema sp.]
MVFFVLNIITALVMLSLTYYMDRKLQRDISDTSYFLTSMLIVTIESVLFTLALLVNKKWIDGLVNYMIRGTLFFDGLFWVLFSTALVNLGLKKKTPFIAFIKIALTVLAFVFVYSFDYVEITADYKLYIESKSVFTGDAQKLFPLTIDQLYIYIFHIIIPFFGFIFYMLLEEKSGNSLLKYRGVVVGEGILIMWAVSFFLNFLAKINSGYTSLFMLPYLFMFSCLISALSKNSIPSGKTRIFNVFRGFVSYLIPALAISFLIMYIQPTGKAGSVSFVVEFIIISIVGVLVSTKVSQLLLSTTRLYTADYADSLEKDLATIDYSAEMDEITERMYQIFRRNVQSSSMNVYIADNKGSLITAYSSNKKDITIPLNNPMFDVLLNINKSVVCYTEVGHVHDISAADEALEKFFNETNSDAFFLLNEGRNVLGLITLGKRVNGDHYKDYDLDIFNKLYSYFFVFGYYMRNISNKEIISVVNREIRMSSQIITSIQENIDHIKNPKADTGYLMVPAHNIGGEFIDFIRLTDTRHLFVVGDLSGKGIAASMNMVILKSIIRTYLAETHDFKQLIVKINSFIRNSLRKGTIFSGLFGLIDFDTDTMYYINCGIPALMLYTQVYNNVIEIQGSGHVLGFVQDISPYISVKTTKLNKGDIILTCTDGLVQSHSLRGEMFGKERIQQALLDNSTYPAQRMAQFTFDGLTKFMSKEMEDDVSILVIKYQTAAQFYEDEKPAEENITEEEASESVAEETVVEETVVEETVQESIEEAVTETVTNEEPEIVSSELPVEDTPAEDVAPDPFNMEAFSDEEINAEDLIRMAQEQAEESKEVNTAEIASEIPDDLDLSDFDDMFKN